MCYTFWSYDVSCDHRYLQNNEISVIGSEGFKGVQISQKLYLTGNTLKKLESRAFVDVNIAQL